MLCARLLGACRRLDYAKIVRELCMRHCDFKSSVIENAHCLDEMLQGQGQVRCSLLGRLLARHIVPQNQTRARRRQSFCTHRLGLVNSGSIPDREMALPCISSAASVRMQSWPRSPNLTAAQQREPRCDYGKQEQNSERNHSHVYQTFANGCGSRSELTAPFVNFGHRPTGDVRSNPLAVPEVGHRFLTNSPETAFAATGGCGSQLTQSENAQLLLGAFAFTINFIPLMRFSNAAERPLSIDGISGLRPARIFSGFYLAASGSGSNTSVNLATTVGRSSKSWQMSVFGIQNSENLAILKLSNIRDQSRNSGK